MPLYVPAAASANLAAVPPVSAGIFRPRQEANGSLTTSTLGRLYARPIVLSAGTLDRIGANHAGSATASELLRLGIYRNTNGRPSSLVLDAGTIDLSTATANKTITISQAITEGVYWLAAVRQGPTNTATTLNFSSAGQIGTYGLGTWTELTGAANWFDSNQFMYVAGVTGALPDPFGSPTLLTAGTESPIVAVRYA